MNKDTLAGNGEGEVRALGAAAAIANPDRLAVIGLLARREMTVEGLASELGLDATVIGRYLAELGKAALVSTRKDGHRRMLSLRRETLAELAEWCAAKRGETDPADPPLDIPEGVRQFFAGNRLSSFPARQSKKIAVLRVLVNDFDFGIDYAEAEVNQILLNRYADFATLRRALIDEGIMTRTGGVYRRAK